MTESEKLIAMIVGIVYVILAGLLVINFGGDGSAFVTVVFIIGLIGIEFLAFRMLKAIESRCPQCGKYNAFQIMDQKMIDIRETTVKEDTPIKNSRGERIGSYMQDVATTEYTQKQHLRCRYCGYETTGYRVETYKNRK